MTLEALNYVSVLIFGFVLTLKFSDVSFKSSKKICSLIIIFLLLSQFIVYITFGVEILVKAYPVIVHIPLLLFLIFVFKKPVLISFIAIFLSYMLCTPRKFSGMIVASFFNNNQFLSYFVQIIFTFPFLFFIVKHLAPYVVKLRKETISTQFLYLLFPAFFTF